MDRQERERVQALVEQREAANERLVAAAFAVLWTGRTAYNLARELEHLRFSAGGEIEVLATTDSLHDAIGRAGNLVQEAYETLADVMNGRDAVTERDSSLTAALFDIMTRDAAGGE